MERMATGVPGLDTLLHGGVFKGGIYMIQGAPGAGKTILANQLCFAHAKAGGKALYVTLLAESHSRLIGHLRSFPFFDDAVVPSRVTYLSAFKTLEDNGLSGLLETLRREIRQSKASFLVLDGLVNAEETATSPRELKKFINELQTQAGLTNCTIVLLTSAYLSRRLVAAEHTMVDGLIELHSRDVGRRAEREIQIKKLRGSAMLGGAHAFEISDHGIAIHPRVEALYARPSLPNGFDGELTTTGIASLDALFGGGPARHSGTLLMGPAGIGKTTFGLHFLGSEPGVCLSFSEMGDALRDKAARMRMPARDRFDSGELKVIWQPVTEGNVDALCYRLLGTIEAVKARRLFIDGMDGFQKIAGSPDRIGPLLTALINQLRAMGVTTLATAETDIAGIVPGQPLAGLAVRDLSPVADNIVVMRMASAGGGLQRLLTVLKSRETRTDLRFRRFEIRANGVFIEDQPENAALLMTGSPTALPPLSVSPDVPDELGRGG